MSIIVFWLTPLGAAEHMQFSDAELTGALQLCAIKRAEGMRHVCISSELSDNVGKPGVDAVQGGHLPDGRLYDWNKRHRANPEKA